MPKYDEDYFHRRAAISMRSYYRHRERRLAQQREYRQSVEGRAKDRRYQVSDLGKLTQTNYRDNNPLKISARKAAYRALQRGELVKPGICLLDPPLDGFHTDIIEMHHASYDPDHWLDVVFACTRCHQILDVLEPSLLV